MVKKTLFPMLAALVVVATSPLAQAHDTTQTDDGVWCITTGNLNEPTTTYMKTGLDLNIRSYDAEADSCTPHGEDLDAHTTLTATIVAPGGQTMDCPLAEQFGSQNRYSCDEPYYLTEPGQYIVRLVGEIEGSAVDGDYNIAGPVPAFSDHTFPAQADDNGALTQDVAALKVEIAALEARIAALEGGSADSNGAPGIGVLAALGVVALAFVARRGA